MKDRILNLTVFIEQDKDRTYIAKVPGIPGCYTQGRTIQQARERIKEAIQVCIEADNKENIPIKSLVR